MVANEKLLLMQDGMPAGTGYTKPAPARSSQAKWIAIPALTLLALCWTNSFPFPHFGSGHHDHRHSGHDDTATQCRQVDPLFPGQGNSSLGSLDEYLASPQFFNTSVGRMAGAVRVATQSYDDLGAIGEDARWDAMYPFAEYLEKTFPLVHSTLKLEKVNTHGLLFTWQGSDDSLKPTVLMAHQDVVPVETSTINQWTHPPFSGEFDGKYVWGRGSADDKSSLIGIMGAVEALIDAGFEPARTVVLSFGFDEEISGYFGAAHLAELLLDRYGKDGAAVVVDEGSAIQERWGTLFALPGVTEKGYIDVEIVVRVPGGHSSVPPKHNGIGVMGELITHVEANPYNPHLHDENPFLGILQCGALYAPEFPHKLKKELRRRGDGRGPKACHKEDRLALEAAREGGDAVKYLFTTSAAPDLISGGAKVNALPERTVLTVNHRVNVGDHTSDVREHLARIADKVARKHNLTLHAFTDGEAETPSSITLRAVGVLEPAPVSPTEVLDGGAVTPWSILSGTTRALYGEDTIMAPALMTGNTDTRYYWGLSSHIFRFMPGYDVDQNFMEGIHTVDEKISILAHVRGVQWYSIFLRNMDEAEL